VVLKIGGVEDVPTAVFVAEDVRIDGKFAGGGTSERHELTLEQRYQKIEGSISLGQVNGGLREARLRGFHIDFAFVDDRGVRREFSGRVTGALMEGAFRGDNGSEGRWTAAKK
jgi:hypothetical protein